METPAGRSRSSANASTYEIACILAGNGRNKGDSTGVKPARWKNRSRKAFPVVSPSSSGIRGQAISTLGRWTMNLRGLCLAMIVPIYALSPPLASEAPLSGMCVPSGGHIFAQPVAFAATLANDTCARPTAGAVVAEPANLYSRNGVLSVTLNYVTQRDSAGRTLYCFKTPAGQESPTLHVRPGDTLKITLVNRLPAAPGGHVMSMTSDVCGASTMTVNSVNIHYHGTNTAPTCHSDEVLHTLVNPGQSFVYRVKFPADEPAGLYWYHPHVHGISEEAVLGGASGAIVVEGIAKVQPAVAGLPTRILAIRDQKLSSPRLEGPASPAKDLTLNYVPITYPAMKPAVIETPAGRREFWRIVNASADTPVDLQLLYDGTAQPFEIVALDGVATGSQEGAGRGKAVPAKNVLLPPGGRAEFIVATPSANVKKAVLRTLYVNTGPLGSYAPARTLAEFRIGRAAELPATASDAGGMPGPQRFAGIEKATISARRKLYFSEVPRDPEDPYGSSNFYITVDGAKPARFNPAHPPAITTRQGAVEEWTIENRTKGVHEFHIHQIHFQLLARNGRAVPIAQRQFLDTVQVPHWSGSGPYPSVTLLMDFRGNIAGDFPYHCHILSHEDAGMMAMIRVLPSR
jgi:FtsP/CotA-like multicopper oxidase with cupredoxin domain